MGQPLWLVGGDIKIGVRIERQFFVEEDQILDGFLKRELIGLPHGLDTECGCGKRGRNTHLVCTGVNGEDT